MLIPYSSLIVSLAADHLEGSTPRNLSRSHATSVLAFQVGAELGANRVRDRALAGRARVHENVPQFALHEQLVATHHVDAGGHRRVAEPGDPPVQVDLVLEARARAVAGRGLRDDEVE